MNLVKDEKAETGKIEEIRFKHLAYVVLSRIDLEHLEKSINEIIRTCLKIYKAKSFLTYRIEDETVIKFIYEEDSNDN